MTLKGYNQNKTNCQIAKKSQMYNLIEKAEELLQSMKWFHPIVPVIIVLDYTVYILLQKYLWIR